jgi:hypothetical protein
MAVVLDYMWVDEYSIAQPLSTAGCGAKWADLPGRQDLPRFQPGTAHDGEKSM